MTELEGLGAWLDGRATGNEFSGVALVTHRGETVFEHAAGLAHRGHGVPVTMGTRFEVASITKMVTATAAMRLVEKGSLDLYRPLTSFLPAEYRPSALDERHTLHHLLSHTAGIPGYHDHDDETWDSFIGALERVQVSRARGPKDLLPLFADLPLEFDPGSQYVYCDSNFIMVGILLEWVTGREFGAVVQEEVLGPAGMEDTAITQLDLEPRALASHYLMTDGPADEWRSNIYSVPAGGMSDGGMITTAGDQVRLLDALSAGRVVSSETWDLMQIPHGVEEGSPEAYGYGVELVVVDGRVTIIGHSGGDPGISGMVSRWLDEDITMVVLCNQDRGSWPVVQHIAAQLGLDDPRE